MSLTEALALDCEMVEAEGRRGYMNMAARVSVVNEYFHCVYDTYVWPSRTVTDYRTQFSGIEPHHLQQGRPIEEVRTKVADWLRGRILVGHDVVKDLKVLGLCHPEWNVRDTAYYPEFQTARGKPSLKNLAWEHVGMRIQNGAHDSVRDARAAMKIYKLYEDEWEEWLDESDDDSDSSTDVDSSYY